jgi:ketosteroid isomerase-like protein
VPELVDGPPSEGRYPDIDLVRRLFRLLEIGDHDRMLALYAEDFEGHTVAGVSVKGRSAARRFVRQATEGERSLEPATFRIERNGSGQVGVFGRLRVRGPDGVVDTPAAWILSIEDGKVTRAESYTSMNEAQRALQGVRG